MTNPNSPEPLTISHQETAKRGKFDLGEEAEMTYTRPTPHVMKINHTLVDPRHRGKGMAHQLYRAMVEYARAHQRKVIPVCTFVEAMFVENPQDRDLLIFRSSAARE